MSFLLLFVGASVMFAVTSEIVTEISSRLFIRLYRVWPEFFDFPAESKRNTYGF
jgi:hypothetical protein